MRLWTIIAALFFSGIAMLGPQVANAGEVPFGTYVESCINVRSNGYTLSAWCRSGSETMPRYSRLHRVDRCLFVENQNGRLVCTRRFNVALPAGSYVESCTRCQFDGENLECTCIAKPGYFVHQEHLNHVDRCHGDIGYSRNGLQCLHQPVPTQYRKVVAVTPPVTQTLNNVTPPEYIALIPTHPKPNFASAYLPWTQTLTSSITIAQPKTRSFKNWFA